MATMLGARFRGLGYSVGTGWDCFFFGGGGGCEGGVRKMD